MMFIPEIEAKSAEEIRQFQWQELKKILSYVNQSSPYYQRLFKSHHIDIHQIESWSDFQRLPITTKDELQKHNWEFLAAPRSHIIEYTSTSGTLGKPVTIGLTKRDMDRLAYNESISFACADGSSDDLFQLMLTLDRQFMAGIAYYEGIRRLEAGVIRTGPGLPALQLDTILRLQPTTLVAVPSFIIKLIEYANETGVSLNDTSVKKIVCIGEAIRRDDLSLNTLGEYIQSKWNVRLYGTYASTEMQTAFTECKHGIGGHLHPELIVVEVLDENLKEVSPGEIGEITITTLGIEGMPLIRYRTGDMARTHSEPCACGRNTLRVGPVVGRKQQMIKLKGTTLYPPAIFDILQQISFVKDFVVEAYTNTLGLDDLRVHVHVSEDNTADCIQKISSSFQSHIRVIPEILIQNMRELESMQTSGGRKIRRFLDHR